jgi:hypothetical protein
MVLVERRNGLLLGKNGRVVTGTVLLRSFFRVPKLKPLETVDRPFGGPLRQGQGWSILQSPLPVAAQKR